MTDNNLAELQTYIGRSETNYDTLSPVPARCLAATLSLPHELWPSKTLPPLWHWIYFLDATPTEQLADDGTARTRSLMPPVKAEQIMWAGAEFDFTAPLAIGVSTAKYSRIADISMRDGSRGPMVFVTLEHRYEQAGQTMVVERYRIVYLGAALPGGKSAAPATPAVITGQHNWLVNEAVLFRFSALTFNTHRIHYDLPYATGVAGYPALVVHGPLQAMLIAETLRLHQPGAALRKASFRAKAPLYCSPEGVTVCAGEPDGPGSRLWTRDAAGGVAMEGRFET